LLSGDALASIGCAAFPFAKDCLPIEPQLHPAGSPPLALDTGYRIETPEGIELTLRPAGLVIRALAFGVDLAIRGVMLIALLALLRPLSSHAGGGLGAGLGALIVFLVSWWYMVLFEVFNHGRTPGKAWLRLRVVMDNGAPIGGTASLIRNLLRTIDMLPFGYFFGALACLHHPAFKRLGDLAAGSLVVHQDVAPTRPTIAAGPACAQGQALTRREQQAILAFAERRSQLSAERAAELAELVAEPLRLPAGQAVTGLDAVARGLLGQTT